MDHSALTRIAERFVSLSPENRRAVYQQMRARGMSPSQFPILPRPANTPAVLSYAQARQWFLWNLDPASTAYHINSALRLRGRLDLLALQFAFSELTARHESLRTIFQPTADGSAEPVVLSTTLGDVRIVDLRSEPASSRENRALQEAERLTHIAFDLTQGPLLRVVLIRLAEEEAVLLVVMHHIVTDGWSMRVAVEDLVELYRARVAGRDAALPSLSAQYSDYALWQRSWLEAGEQERQLDYWRQQLGSDDTVLQLPVDRPRHSIAKYRAARCEFEIPKSLSTRLVECARSHDATVFMILLCGFQVLLQSYTNQREIRVGVPHANRNRIEAERVIGLFANTHVLTTSVEEHLTLGALITRVRETVLAAQAHQELPFERLVEALQPERSLSHNPLFQVMMNHQRRDSRNLQRLPNLSIEPYELGEHGAQVELTLNTFESPSGGLEGTFLYAAEIFEATTVKRLAAHYMRVLGTLADKPEHRIRDLELIDEIERDQQQRWGVGPSRFIDTTPVHAVFEQRVRKCPSEVAVVFGILHLSYADLNCRANQLANRLIGLGVGPETRVGIALEPSFELVLLILAVLKAGGAYVPLDADYPLDRLRFMLTDSGVSWLITRSGSGAAQLAGEQVGVLALDEQDLTGESEDDPHVAIHPENLAYVIYTSGSTGLPKGAANRHCSLSNRLAWMQHAYELRPVDAVLQKTPFSFDVSVWEFLWPLLQGARLIVAPPGAHRDPDQLVALIRRHSVSTIHFVPSMLQAFLDHPAVGSCRSLQRIVCSGEALSAQMQSDVFSRLPGVKLYNLYGPTEAAIDVTHWTCVDNQGGTVPIGRPIADTRTFVLSPSLQSVPQGVAGELYLGGIGLGRGYLNRAGLSSERFIADPLSGSGERLYRTGDLARWNTAGELEYLGRLDHQVKVRGFRIELGEIESQLLLQPEVREAVVVAQDSNAGTRLVAYVVPRGMQVEGEALRERLSRALPDYMVPAVVMTLQHLPLNANGKLDRKALPAPTYSASIYEAPRGDFEEIIAQVWSQVLGLPRIGRKDNFFGLGGHSLQAIKATALAQEALQVDARVQDLFEVQTLEHYAARLEARPRVADDEALATVDAFLGNLESA